MQILGHVVSVNPTTEKEWDWDGNIGNIMNINLPYEEDSVQCILLVLISGSKTWCLTKDLAKTKKSTNMLETKWALLIREETKIEDIPQMIRKKKKMYLGKSYV